MVKNITLAVTDLCNGKCSMCNIWKKTDKHNLLIAEIEKILANSAFIEVDTISITGGEPFLRDDLKDIIDLIHRVLPNVNRLFLNTNGTILEKVVDICKYSSELFENVILSISLEGNKEINEKVRGVDTFDNVLKIIERVKGEVPSVSISMSTTITKINSSYDNLLYIRNLSIQKGCMFSFRFADVSAEYYCNANMDLIVPEDTKRIISNFIEDYCSDNEFLNILKEYIDTGKMPMLVDSEGKNKCLAGKEFVFINSKGEVHPCIYSEEILGSSDKMVDLSNVDNSLKKCVCCTDCVIYPILEYNKRIRDEKV